MQFNGLSTARRGFLGYSAGLLGLCLLASPALAADDPAPAQVVLFDGKSLEGWKKTDFSGAGEVKVEDGVIVMAEGRSMTGVTTTRKDLPTTNYELSYEAQRVKGSDFFAAATFPVGKSFITLVNGGWSGSVTGLSSLDGADASENDTTTFVKYQENTWYRFRVRVTDERIQCWVDDDQVIDVEHKDRHVGTRLETYANQPLGFATYETSGQLRKVAIKKLTAEEVAATNAGGK